MKNVMIKFLASCILTTVFSFTLVAQPGNALDFDGVNDYVAIPAISSGWNDLTIETWINLSQASTASGHGIFNTNSWTTGDIHFQIWANTIQMAVCGNGDVTANYTFVPNQWYHLAATYNATGKTAKIYVNGLLIQTANLSNDTYANLTAAQIGAYTTSRYFNGKMDEYRIWNRVLTQAEIQEGMHIEMLGNEPDLRVLFTFEESMGTLLTDRTFSGTDGTLINFALSGNTSNWVPSSAMCPFVLNATNVGADGFTANWVAVSGATGYKMDVDDNSDFSSPLISEVDAGNATSFYVSGLSLTSGSTYYYQLRAVKNSWTSPNSVAVSFNVISNGLSFDGINDQVSLPVVNVAGNKLTIEAWVNMKDRNTTRALLRQQLGANFPDWLLQFGTTTFNFGIVCNSTWVNMSVPYPSTPENKWMHVACVYDGTIKTVYFNGIVAGTQAASGNVSFSSGGWQYLASSNAVEMYNGKVDELRIWNVARSQSELQNAMHSELIGNETGLKAYYRFNQSTGTSVLDATANAANGTFSDAPVWVASEAMCPIIGEASNIGQMGFTANWAAVSGATAYLLDVDDNSDFSSMIISAANAGNGTSFEVTGIPLTSGTSYYYRLRALIGGRVSQYSDTKSFMVAPGNGMSFDGVNDYVQIPRSVQDDFTIELWFNSTQVYGATDQWYNGAGLVDGEVAGTLNDFGVSLSQGKVMFGTGNPDISIISSSTYNDGKWHHVAASRTKSTGSLNLYVDGKLVATGTGTTASLTSPSYLRMGMIQRGSSPYSGKLDDVRIWNSVRSQNDIQSTMQSELLGNESNLVAYYKFNQSSGTQVFDLTSNNYHGAIVDAPSWVASEALCPFVNAATNISSSGFTANWTAINGATGYKIDVDDNIDFSSPLILDENAGSGTSHNVTGLSLTPGTTYYYRLRAEKGIWTSPSSPPKSFLVAPGNALNFDGINDFVDIPDNDATISTAFTIETWINWNPATTSDVQFICGKAVEQMEIHTAGGAGAGGLRFIPTSGLFLDATNVLPLGVWTHVAVVYDKTVPMAKMYINGNEVNLANNSGTAIGASLVSGTSNFSIGRRGSNMLFFKGSMDEFRLWNIARSENEIRDDMFSQLSGSEANLVSAYSFDQTGSTTLPDASSLFNGTLNNFSLSGTPSNWTESYAMVSPGSQPAENILATSFVAQWTAPAAGVAEKYLLDVSTASDFSSFLAGYNALDCGTNLSQEISGLTAGTTYYYRVRAEKASVTGQGLNSNVVSATTLAGAVSPVISWADPANIEYETPISSTQCNATASYNGFAVAGTFAYSPALDSVLYAGNNQELTVIFTPSNGMNFSIAYDTAHIDVLKATPSIDWANPADIIYGKPLTFTQLNATTAFNGHSVPGDFYYRPDLDSVLNAGNNQDLSTQFFPTDTSNFNPADKTVQINVLPATPVIVWDPADITYGIALDDNILNAVARFNGMEVAGTFTYLPPATTILTAGDNQPLLAAFTSSYPNFKDTVEIQTINVLKATPVITWDDPADIYVDDSLTSSQLNASAAHLGNTIDGSFTYNPVLNTKLAAGNHQALAAEFIPADVANYKSISDTVYINVLKHTPEVQWPDPSDIEYGTALDSTHLNAQVTYQGQVVAGTYNYSPAADYLLNCGANQALALDFMPDDQNFFNSVNDTAYINVSKAKPLILWDNPADIIYGELLSPGQLNAIVYHKGMEVPGIYAYNPGINTTLEAGNAQKLTVIFTPDDLSNYEVAYDTVTINVVKRNPEITWNTPGDIVYGTALSTAQLNAIATYNSITVPGTFIYSPNFDSILNVGNLQDLTVAFIPDDITSYAPAYDTVQINVMQATPEISWSDQEDIMFGTLLSDIQLNATANVDGLFVYDPPAGTELNTGGYMLSVTFTPADANYSIVTSEVSIYVAANPDLAAYCQAGTDTYWEYIHQVTLGSIDRVSGYGDNGYQNFTSNITNLEKGVFDTLIVWMNSTYPGDELLAWIDFNRDGDFEDEGENIYSPSGAFNPLQLVSFYVPQTASLGRTRMRIRLNDAGTDPSNYPNSTPCGSSTYGEIEDYSVNIVESTTPMALMSSTASQVGNGIFRGLNRQAVIRVNVAMNGGINPLQMTSIRFNTLGTTNHSDILNAEVYYTGGNVQFENPVLFGSFANPDGDFEVQVNTTLSAGINYFWLTYDISSSAILNDTVDAQVLNFTVGGIEYTPTVTNPNGYSIITDLPLTFIQNIHPVVQGSINQKIIEIQINNTSGRTLELNSIMCNLNGTTNLADISKLSVYYSLNSEQGAFGSGITNPGNPSAFSGSLSLNPGENFIQLICDVSVTATIGNVIDARVEALTINGSAIVPEFGNPDSARVIKAYSGNEFTNFMPASIVVGQPDFYSQDKSVDRDGGIKASGVAISSKGMMAMVSQSTGFNGIEGGRVLLWNSAPDVNGAPADVVIGQPDFTSAFTSACSQSRVSWLMSAAFSPDGNQLLVADAGNNRVLVFNAPFTNGMAASVVIGQSDFYSSSSGCSATKMYFPYSVFVHTDGRLFVSDGTNNRILIYNQIPSTNGVAANVVVGQVDFTSNIGGCTQSNFQGPNTCTVSPDGKLIVCDGGTGSFPSNSRVLIFNTIPTTNGALADVVIGETDFVSVAESSNVSDSTMYYPYGVSVSPDGKLAIGEFGSSRVLIYNSIPTENGAHADVVLGQPDFTSTTQFNGDVTEYSMKFPYNVSFDLYGRAFVAGRDMHRIMIFGEKPTKKADLEASFAAENSAVLSGGEAQYSLVIKNNGPSSASNIIVNCALPVDLEFVSALVSSGSYIDSTGYWTIPSIASGSADTLTITGTVISGFEGATIRAFANIVNSGELDLNMENNAAYVDLTIKLLWTGTVSSNWSDTANWSSNTVPGLTQSVTIPSLPSGGRFPEYFEDEKTYIKNLTIEPGAHLTLPDTSFLCVYGNFINMGNSFTGEGGIVFEGSSPQQLQGKISRVNVNNTKNIFLGGLTEISTELYFSRGKVFLGDYNLKMGDTAEFRLGKMMLTGIEKSGASFASSLGAGYVVTDGQGSVIQKLDSTERGILVGTTDYYMPLNIINTGDADYYSIRVRPGVLEHGTTGNVVSDINHFVNASWIIEEEVPGGSNLDMLLAWSDLAEGSDFENSSCGIGLNTGTTLDHPTMDMAIFSKKAGGYVIARDSITTLGTFAVGDSCSRLAINAAPALLADNSDNDPLHDISITFAKNQVWVDSITSVQIDNGADIKAICTMDSVSITIPMAYFPIGNKNYTVKILANAYTTATITQRINKHDQIISLNSVSGLAVGESFTISVSSSSGLPVSLTNCNANIIRLQGNLITAISQGEAVIIASQAGNDIYEAAENVLHIITTYQYGQTITFNPAEPKVYGDAPFVISATGGSSGNPVYFTSSDNAVATCNGAFGENISIVAPGTCKIIANQAGNDTLAQGYAEYELIINAKLISANGITAQNKTYDGTNAATLVNGNLNGTISGDDVTLVMGTGTFASVNAGTGIQVNLSGFSLSGADAWKYELVQPGFVTADITKAEPIITWIPVNSFLLYGQSLETDQLNASSNIAGTFAYTPAAGTILYIGENVPVIAEFTPDDQTNYDTASLVYYFNVDQYYNTNALDFDGVNDKVSIPVIGSGLAEVTFETWVKADALTETGYNAIFNTNTWNSGKVFLQFNNKQLEFNVNGANAPAKLTYTFENGIWYHVAITYSSTAKQVQFYVNGRLMQTNMLSVAPELNLTAALLGAWNSSRYFSGELDEFRVWNVVRTSSQIKNDLVFSIDGNNPDLLAYYSVNQITGLTLLDYSPKRINGTLVNFAMTGTTSNYVETGAMCPINLSTSNISANGFTAHCSPIPSADEFFIDLNDNSDFSSPILSFENMGTDTALEVSGLTLTSGINYYYRIRAAANILTPYSAVESFVYTPVNALAFDGANDYVICPTVNPAIFTMEAWVNPAIVNRDQAFVSTLQEGALSGAELHIGGDGKPVLTIRNGSSWLDVVSPYQANSGSWIHVAGSYDGTTAKLYVDGVLVASKSASTYTPGTSNLYLGRRSSGLLPFNGMVDECRIWSTAKSGSEILTGLYNEMAGNESGLIAYYNFNLSSGTFLSDGTINNNDGTLNNFELSGNTSNWVESYAMVVPVLQAATNIDKTSFKVNWNAPQMGIAEKYLLDVSTVANFSSFVSGYNALDCGENLSQEVNGLNYNTKYFYRVRAEKASVTGQGANSLTDSVITPDLVNPVITWENPADIIYGTPLSTTQLNASADADGSFVYTPAVGTILKAGDNQDIKVDFTPADAANYYPASKTVKINVIPTGLENALAFDGANDYVSIPALGAQTGFTIETWFNATAFSTGFNGIYNTNTWTTGSVHCQFNNGKVELSFYDASLKSVLNYNFQTGQWYHLATTYNSVNKQVSFYVNGQLVQTDNLPSAPSVNLSDARMGSWSGDDRYFNGMLDEYRIWNSSLTLTEIQENMHGELSGNETGLLAYYQFNHNAGAILPDVSNNAKHGNLNNFALSGTTSNWVSSGAFCPFILSATNINPNGFTANWYAVSGSTEYLIDVDDNNDFSSPIISALEAGNGTSFEVDGLVLSSETVYYYRMRVVKSNWTSPNSAAKFFLLPPAMSAPGNALNFDGTNDFVSLPDNDDAITTAFTIETWINWNPSTPGDVQFICGKSTEQMEIHTGGGAGSNGLRFIPTSGVYLDAGNVLPVGVWTHVAVVYDKTIPLAKMYINGKEVALVNHGSAAIGANLVSGSNSFSIGRRGTNMLFLKGSIDEFKLWNTARTESEIAANMNRELNGPENGLVAYYKFNQTIQTVVYDHSSASNYGTLNNFALTGTTSNWVESYAMVVPFADQASQVFKTKFTANWDAPLIGQVDKYLVDVSENSNFTSFVSGYSALDCGAGLSHTFTDLIPNTTYYYRVRAQKASVSGQGGYSSAISVTTLDTVVSPEIAWEKPIDISYGTALSDIQLNATASYDGAALSGTFTYNPPAGTVLNMGDNQVLSVLFTPSDTINYGSVSKTVTINVLNESTPIIVWANPGNIFYGTALDSTQLNATASVPGTFVYTPGFGQILNAGANQELHVLFTPTDLVNYTIVSKSVYLNVLKANPVLTWSNPAEIEFGTALSETQLNASSNIAGTFNYNPTTGTTLNAGENQVLSVLFTPSDTQNYNTETTTVLIDVLKANPSIVWENPADIVYGTALDLTQLNATASIPGTFAYNPAMDSILNAGENQSLNVVFTPNDVLNYNTANAVVYIDVLKAIPVISWNNPADIVYGTALSPNELNATASLAGTFVYSPALGALLNAGNSQILSVVFTPDNNTNYSTATATVSINVLKASPAIIWENPADIVYGTLLGNTQLNATSNIEGTFVYSPGPGHLLNAGENQELSLVFTPQDNQNYNPANASVYINVLKANPVLSWTSPADIVFGTLLGNMQLNATSNVAGTFVYNPSAGTLLNAGNAIELSAEFSPVDVLNYNSGTVSTYINVLKATPVITWQNPTDIMAGTALSDIQLNATANAAGTFVYTPPAGTVLETGNNHVLLAEFTPADTTNYHLASKTVTINVVDASTPIISWFNPADITYGTLLDSIQLNASSSVPGNFVYTPPAGTLLNAGLNQMLSVEFTPDDLENFNVVSKSVFINVLKATPLISWETPAAVSYGTLLDDNQLNASSSIEGTFIYTPPAGTQLPAGENQELKVLFNPNDTTNYYPVEASVFLDVLKYTPAIAWNNPADIVYGTALGDLQLNASSDVEGSFSYLPAAGTILNAGTNHELIVDFTPADTANYNSVEKSVFTQVLKATPVISWQNPTDIVLGTALTETQLNATANTNGSFVYTPAIGTVLALGNNQALLAEFTPADTSNFISANKTVFINVLDATTPIVVWYNPSDIVYGTLLDSTQLNATASVNGTFAYSPGFGTLLNAGENQELSLVFTPADTNLQIVSKSVFINVWKATPVLAWEYPENVVYGTALSNSQLNASANIAGTFVYSPAAGTILNAGINQELTVEFIPNDTLNYNMISTSVFINVLKAIPSISWQNPTDIIAGTALSEIQLNATSNTDGIFVYTPPAGTILELGNNHALLAEFTPADSNNYHLASKTVYINVVDTTTPIVTWFNPSDIVYGTLLDSTQLNATVNVAGTFMYSPGFGTQLNAGDNQSLSLEFTPADTNMQIVNKSVFINVLKATPNLVWNNPDDMFFGELLDSTQLNASANVEGEFVYNPAFGTELSIGNNQALHVTFIPVDTQNYNTTEAMVYVNVLDPTIPIITWNNPAVIVYGTPLGINQLNATANVEGEFVYTPDFGTVLNAGNNQELSVLFTPADTNMQIVSKSVVIDVQKASPILTWNNPADMVYGILLGNAQLNATANIEGNFAYTPETGTLLNAGYAQELNVEFIPTDTANYTIANKTVYVNVLKALPVINWGNPADIIVGTALSDTQLNASCNVAGTLAYTPGIGTVLAIGPNQALLVDFTPDDTLNYQTTGKTVYINVLRDDAILPVNKQNIAFYPNPSFGILTFSGIAEQNSKDGVQIEILDVQGNTILIQNFDGSYNTSIIDLSNCSAGTYMVKIKTGDIISIQRLVKL